MSVLVEVKSGQELDAVLALLPRLGLRQVARVRISCESEIRRRVADLARAEGMDFESAIIGAKPNYAELDGVPGCVVRIADCCDDDDTDEPLEATPLESEIAMIRLADIEGD